MSSVESKLSVASRIFAPANGIGPVPEAGPNPGSGIDDDDWFYGAAVTVFGSKDTGQHLHLATGWPRTSCYAFVARDPEQRRKVPSEFLRVLFRSPHGAPFHRAFMHGCTARWFLDQQRCADIGGNVLALVERK